MQGQARIRGIKLNRKFHDSDVELQIDQMRTIQILLNLISNAIKFSPEDGQIDIECKYKNQKPGIVKVEISVTDFGIGICDEDQKYIFTPFFKTKDSGSRALNSTSHGLGLNICQQIAKGLSGEIIFESKLGKGTKFTFQFTTAAKQENKLTKPTQIFKVTNYLVTLFSQKLKL